MKNKIAQFLLIVVALFSISLISKAQSKALTNGYPIVTLPHTFNGDSKDIDVDGNNSPDFAIEFSGSVPFYNYRIYGIDPRNQVFVEYYGAPVIAAKVDQQLTSFGGGAYVSILPYQTQILGPVGAPLTPALQSVNISIEPYWSSEGIILGVPSLPGTALHSATISGATDGYIGVYYNRSGSYYTGWLHYQYAGSGSFKILSAGSSPTSGAPVLAGAGDPYASPIVPVSIIVSLIGLFAIGGGTYFRHKKKI